MSKINLNEVQRCIKCNSFIVVNDYTSDYFDKWCYDCIEDYTKAIHKRKWDLDWEDFLMEEEKEKYWYKYFVKND